MNTLRFEFPDEAEVFERFHDDRVWLSTSKRLSVSTGHLTLIETNAIHEPSQ
jgi:hypothetical protein